MPKLVLEKIRKKRKLSKREFSKRIKMPYKNVWRVFRPNHNPRFKDLIRYAKGLECKVRDLIEG